MFDLFVLGDNARRLVQDQFEARPSAPRVAAVRTDRPAPVVRPRRRPARFLASLRAVADR
jgi:hypothetical protein